MHAQSTLDELIYIFSTVLMRICSDKSSTNCFGLAQFILDAVRCFWPHSNILILIIMVKNSLFHSKIISTFLISRVDCTKNVLSELAME